METPPPPGPSPPPSTPVKHARLRKLAAAALGVLIIATVLFLVGRTLGRKPVGALEERATAAEVARDSAATNARLLEALALTYRSALDLDERNFGTANANLQAAVAALEAAGGAGVDTAALARVKARARGMNVAVATNLEAQRRDVLALADALNALLPAPLSRPAPAPAEPVPSTPTR